MKRKVFIAISASLALLFLVWGAKKRPTNQTLADGTVIALAPLKVGNSNVFEHGSALGKILGTLIPSKGVTISKWKLERPTLVRQSGPQEFLSAEFAVFPPSNTISHLINPRFYRQQRVVITGDKNDFPYIAELNGFGTFEDGHFTQIVATIFPRDSRILSFRIEERDTPTELNWRELTTLRVANPKPSKTKIWMETKQRELLLPNGFLVEFGKLEVRHVPEERRDIWEPSALLPIRVSHQGKAIGDFGVVAGEVSDSSGNWVHMPTIRSVSNEWTVYRMFRPMDPTKLWKFDLRFALHRGYPQTNIFAVPISIPFRARILTNASKHPVHITVQNDRMISVDLPEKPAGLRLQFVDAQTSDGRSVAEHAGSWSQHNFMRFLEIPTTGEIKITFAIVEEFQASVILKPHVDLAPLLDSGPNQ